LAFKFGSILFDLPPQKRENCLRNDSKEGLDVKKKVAAPVCAIVLTFGLVLGSASRGFSGQAASQDEGRVDFVSAVLSLFYFPVKLATCVTGATLSGAAYVLTYRVAGNDGDTYGKDAGEVANRSCGGPWLIQPDDVKSDYQYQ
jgi:hypothetical protein